MLQSCVQTGAAAESSNKAVRPQLCSGIPLESNFTLTYRHVLAAYASLRPALRQHSPVIIGFDAAKEQKMALSPEYFLECLLGFNTDT